MELTLKNFKCFKDTKTYLTKFNVIVGRNNTGKSNFLKSLRLIAYLFEYEGIKRFLETERLSYEELVYNFDLLNPIELKVKLNEVSYSISLKSDLEGNYWIDREQVGSIDRTKHKYSFGKRKRKKEHGISVKNSILHEISSPYRLEGFKKEYKDLSSTLLRLSKIRVFTFDEKKMKFPTEIVKEEKLKEDGSNLANFLHSIFLSSEKEFSYIRDLFCEAIPDWKDVRLKLTENKKVYISLKNSEEFPSWTISDGSLKILAFISKLVHSSKDELICFEEPEIHVHAKLLESLVDIAKNSKATVLFTTHSPVVLDFVDPEDLIVAKRVKEGCSLERIQNPKKLKQILRKEGLTLGEAYRVTELDL